METSDQISLFQEFFELNYQNDILESLRKEDKCLSVDFGELSKFNPELADNILENPENVVKAAELAI